jgi:hypothetical protein
MHPKYWKTPRLMDQATDGTTGGAAGGSGPLDTSSAASAFESHLGDEPEAATTAAATTNEATAEHETDEQAAERLAREEAGAAEPTAGDAPQSFTIKVDGKDVTLTADQMAEHVKAGMRQQDYTAKTMALAEQRKAADAEATQARAQRDEYATKLEQFSGQANYELNALRAQLTAELLESDPVTYLSTQRTVEQRQAQLAQAQQELQQINGQRQQEHARAQAAYYQDQQQKLLAKIPEWSDPAKVEADVVAIKKYLGTQDFAPEEQVLPDHRLVVLARKAMQFDALMERARSTTKKVAAAPPKVERPGNADSARPGDGRTTAMKHLQKTGSIDAAAAAFNAFLN